MPILSICIPTYNRCGYLYLTLKSIVEQELFQNTTDVEIVISDNCSTDLTEKISKIFADKYPDKVIYNRNEINIGGDKNFEKALTLGNGEVLNLHNDNYLFRDDSLQKMVEKIKTLRETKPTIFFSNGNSRINDSKLCKSLDELVTTVSCSTTWISSFSIWKNYFETFDNFSRNVHTNLMQVDVLFRTIAEKRGDIFVFDDRLFEEQPVPQKGGYNLAKVFGDNYLTLLEAYLGKDLDREVYEKEKKFLLLEHIIPTKFIASLKNDGYIFGNDGYWKHLHKHYKHNLYFYTSIFKISNCLLNVFLYRLNKMLNPNAYKKYWRKRNKHNDTHINKASEENKIFVGNDSRGFINAEFTDNINEILIIENNVSIGENVKFVFGKNELIIISDNTKIPDNSIITEST